MKQLILLLGLVGACFAMPAAAADPPPLAASPSAGAAAGAPAAAAAPASAAAPAAPAAAPATPAKSTGPAAPIQVQVVTSLGNFVIELNPERAPLTVAQFLKYVDLGQYSGTLFHRVIPNFVIQGGGFDTDYKLKSAPYKVNNESGNGLPNVRATVGLARPQEPHAGDCQFYVNIADNAALDPNQTRWGYAVFGKVVQGMEVVDHISNVPTGAKGPFKEDAPQTAVVIERIERIAAP